VSPVFSKQKRATLTDQALRQIREAIRSGKLKPGDRLVETQLAEEMHISRFPIREALRYLEKEGLVHAEPFKGTYVAQLTEKDMEELYSLRSAIEELAVRILLKTIDAKKIKKLESIVASMIEASKSEDIDKMITEDLRFHQTICELSGHRRLLDVWLNLENQLHIFLTIEKDLFGNSLRFVTTHHPILEAIKGRKIRPAQKAIRDHFNLATEVIRQGYWERNSKKKKTKGKRS
jgi:DNA-binding GntR family transcriptional regulator